MARPCLGFSALLALVVTLLPGVAHADAFQTLSRAENWHEQLRADPPPPPSVSARGTTVSLPDRFGLRGDDIVGVRWYRFHLERVPDQALWGVYIPHAHANAVAYLNGEWLGQGGRFAEPAAHTWNRPLYFPVVASRLQRIDNVLEVGVQADGALFNGLDAVLVGSDRILRPRFERAFALRVTPAQASTTLSLAVLLIFGILALALREASYGCLAVAGGFYAVASLNYHWLEPPLSTWTFNTLTNLSLQCAGFALGLLGFLWVDMNRPRLVRLTFALAGLCALAALVLPPRVFERVMIWGYLVVAMYTVGGFVSLWRARRLMHVREWLTYCTTASLLVPIALYDLVLQVQVQRGSAPLDAVRLIPYFGPIMLSGASVSLLLRFVRVYRRAQLANQVLAAEVAEKRRELSAHYEQMRSINEQRLLLQERERIMHEMHDGVGGHLVSALALIERGSERNPEALRAVRAALDDMRLVVQAMAPDTGDISFLLADMRRRLEPRLRAQGIRFRWAVEPAPAPPRLGNFEVLHVLRILQEAITNVLKHARATAITIASSGDPESGALSIEVRDDGCGFRSHAARGRGLPSMEQRARQIGASLSVESNDAGTRVRLTIPESRLP